MTTIGVKACPRCRGFVKQDYQEPMCVNCGWVQRDYSPPAIAPKRTIVSHGTQYVLRYVGKSLKMMDRLCHVGLLRLENRVAYDPKCPFCEGAMIQTSQSGKRKKKEEERYRCDSGHRVILVNGNNGHVGWK